MITKISKKNSNKSNNEYSQVEIYNWRGTTPVPPGGCRYWRCTGIIPSENGWVLVFVRNITRLGVVCRYWRATKNVTALVPKIYTGAVL